MNGENMEKYNLPEKLIQEMTEIRQYLHRNPELSGKEYKNFTFRFKYRCRS